MPEPLPESGWSREVRIVEDALVCAPTEARFMQESGVLGPGGDIAEAAIWREGRRFTLPVRERPEPAERLAGTHIWGGMFFGHFGHFITESISRLWAVQSHPAESVIFIPRHSRLTTFQGYQADLVRLLGISVPIRVVDRPVAVERLVVPGQGFGLGAISLGTPEFRAAMQEMAERIEPAGAERIYISRTRFHGRGGVLHEDALEANMEAAGYTTFHPQQLSLAGQLAQYRAATHIVGVDSSAFHVLGFVAHPGQKVAILARRNAAAFHTIAKQIAGMLGRPPVVLNVLSADWMPPAQKMANHLSWGEIDHARLAAELEREGFIASSRDWAIPDEAAMRAAVARAEETSASPLERRATREPSPT